jgi:IS1 family transposase
MTIRWATLIAGLPIEARTKLVLAFVVGKRSAQHAIELIKIYASPREGEQRYSPGEVVEAVPVVISGNPNPNRICTSHVERQNLTMRMQIRRLTRLTNAFSKKFENHKAAIALHFAYYNFAKIHQTLRVTPGMEARITEHVWTIAELLA